ncbi:hypothetical protein F5144DRAFT_519664, partial [Chaetomium tenue]
MPLRELQYPTEPYSKVNRLKDRADYALETIHQIVNSCPMLHVSFQPANSPFPAVLPMIGQMGSFSRPSAGLGDVLDLYLHGYVSSRIINTARSADSQEEGVPMTIAASHLDGLVLSLTPNSRKHQQHQLTIHPPPHQTTPKQTALQLTPPQPDSYNYRSAILFGHATLVTDPAEKLYAMELITNSVVPGRWTHTRVPPNAAEMQSTSVLRVRVSTGSAKIRTGEPHDERGDMEDGELLGRVWTGVVPVYMVRGEPVAGGYNRVGEVPGYLEEWR